jgi:hypothetical protein
MNCGDGETIDYTEEPPIYEEIYEEVLIEATTEGYAGD